MKAHKYPDLWKTHVMPLFKKGDKSLTNYDRLVSLTNNVTPGNVVNRCTNHTLTIAYSYNNLNGPRQRKPLSAIFMNHYDDISAKQKLTSLANTLRIQCARYHFILGPRQANLCLRAFRHDKFQLRMPSHSTGPGIWHSV